ncbi:MAG: biotin/lipoyl-binding protein [Candidatus Peribacteria bacterium]|nr:biotin/lipoyl-binding protein [Candidatus Peribacteria bacterium]
MSQFSLVFRYYLQILFLIENVMTRIHKLFTMSWKKRMVLICGVVLVGAGGRWAYQHFFVNKGINEEYVSNDMIVGRGDISNVLTMNGKAKFSSTQKLTFQNIGKITAVYKKVGDLVKADEVIARMDSYEVDNELEQAKIDLENEQRALEKAQNTSKRELAILQAEKTYQALLYEQEHADVSLNLALQAIENEFTNKKNAYEKLLSDYEKHQKSYESKQKTYDEIMALDKSNQILHADEVLKNKVEDLRVMIDTIRKELDTLDKLMVYTDKYGTKKPDYCIYIGAKDQSVKNTVERLFYEISASISLIDTWTQDKAVLTLPEVSLKSQLIQQYEKIKELAEKKTEFSLAVDKMFEASISSEGMSWSAVSIADGRTLRTSALTAIDEVLGLATPETIGEKRKQELADLKLELDKMSQEVEKANIESSQLETEKLKKISDTKMEYEIKDLEVKIAKTTLDELKQGENEEIKLILNTIKQKKKQIETIQKKYDAYVLRANFDGVITKMNIQVGDTIGGGTSAATSEEKYVYIENPDNLEIQVDIDQSDIAKIAV